MTSKTRIKPHFMRVDNLGTRAAFIEKGARSVAIITRIMREGLITDNEWKSMVNLIHRAPLMDQVIEEVHWIAEVEAANTNQAPHERNRWLNIKAILRKSQLKETHNFDNL